MPKKVLCVIHHDTEHKIRNAFSSEKVICVHKNEVTAEMLNEATALVGNLSKEKVNQMPHLEWFHTESAGVNNYVGNIRSDITLTCSSGCYGHAISEHMIAGVFYFYKKLDHYVRNQKMRRCEMKDKLIPSKEQPAWSLALAILERLSQKRCTPWAAESSQSSVQSTKSQNMLMY